LSRVVIVPRAIARHFASRRPLY